MPTELITVLDVDSREDAARIVQSCGDCDWFKIGFQLFTREEKTYNEFNEINADLRNEHHRAVFYYAVFYPVIEFIGALAAGIMLYYGGLQITTSVLTFGERVAFIYLVEMFFRPIRDLSEKYNILQASMASAERIFSLIDTESQIKNPAHPKKIDNFKGKIEIKNIF